MIWCQCYQIYWDIYLIWPGLTFNMVILHKDWNSIESFDSVIRHSERTLGIYQVCKCKESRIGPNLKCLVMPGYCTSQVKLFLDFSTKNSYYLLIYCISGVHGYVAICPQNCCECYSKVIQVIVLSAIKCDTFSHSFSWQAMRHQALNNRSPGWESRKEEKKRTRAREWGKRTWQKQKDWERRKEKEKNDVWKEDTVKEKKYWNCR